MEGIAEGGGAGWTCWRCISDQYLTVVMIWVKRCIWELLHDSHAVTIQWVHMGADPLLCVYSNIITTI